MIDFCGFSYFMTYSSELSDYFRYISSESIFLVNGIIFSIDGRGNNAKEFIFYKAKELFI
jgi:hypothetical protein